MGIGCSEACDKILRKFQHRVGLQADANRNEYVQAPAAGSFRVAGKFKFVEGGLDERASMRGVSKSAGLRIKIETHPVWLRKILRATAADVDRDASQTAESHLRGK